MSWWNKLEHLAGRWVFDQDRLGYYLMMAALEADRQLAKQIVELMTEEQRLMARRAKDGSWKQY
jgi:hypothetical protein